MRNIRTFYDVRHSGTDLAHHSLNPITPITRTATQLVQQHATSYSPISINPFDTVSVAVRLTGLSSPFSPSSPSTSIPSTSSVLLRFVASQCRYCRLYLGAGFRATLSGGAANHRTSFVSGSRSKCLAICPGLSLKKNK